MNGERSRPRFARCFLRMLDYSGSLNQAKDRWEHPFVAVPIQNDSTTIGEVVVACPAHPSIAMLIPEAWAYECDSDGVIAANESTGEYVALENSKSILQSVKAVNPISLVLTNKPSVFEPPANVSIAIDELNEYAIEKSGRLERVAQKERAEKMTRIGHQRDSNVKSVQEQRAQKDLESLLNSHHQQELFQMQRREKAAK